MRGAVERGVVVVGRLVRRVLEVRLGALAVAAPRRVEHHQHLLVAQETREIALETLHLANTLQLWFEAGFVEAVSFLVRQVG